MKRLTIDEAHVRALKALAALGWATPQQLQKWLGLRAASSAYRALQILLENKLVKTLEDLHPQPYSLTALGCRYAEVSYRKKVESFSVISNLIHRNEAIIALRSSWPNLKPLPRKTMYARGLNPAHAEWGVEYFDGVETHSALLLVDDYQMPSSRALHCWTRRHTPKPSFYSTHKGGIQRWSTVVVRMIVATIGDTKRFKNHIERYAEDKGIDEVRYDLLKLQPVWGVVTC